ncbi:MAG: Hpt domain-containing protein [Oscillospiraceae bacterium]|nr:Hpt domain-containing protein [Oscillospiraceae bacterium]
MNNEDIKGLDVKKGLSIVANNKKVYERLLKSFVGNAFCDQLVEAILSGDSDQIRQKAHSLKGVAGNMHMDDLFELSRSIEAGVKDGQPLSGADDLVSKIKDANKQTMDSINMLLNNPDILDALG